MAVNHRETKRESSRVGLFGGLPTFGAKVKPATEDESAFWARQDAVMMQDALDELDPFVDQFPRSPRKAAGRAA